MVDHKKSNGNSPRVSFRRYVLSVGIIRALIGFLFLKVTLETWMCHPCACTSKEVWKRDPETKRNQTFWMSCFPIELNGEIGPFIDPEPIFFSENSCTQNCSFTINVNKPHHLFLTKSDLNVFWSLGTIIWLASGAMFLITFTLSERFPILLIFFIVYQAWDSAVIVAANFASDPAVQGMRISYY